MDGSPNSDAVSSDGGGGHPARSADAFVESIGINTHLNWAGDINDSPSAVAALQTSGIRYYRVGAASGPGNPYNNFQAPWTTFNALASHGVFANVIWDSSLYSGEPSTWNPTPDAIATGVRGIASFEGPNEKNYSCTSNSSWVAQQRSFMRSLWTDSRAHASSKNIPILSPSMCNSKGMTEMYADSVALGNLLSMADVANMHSYPDAVKMPEVGGLIDSQGGTPSYIDAARQIIPTGPIQTTETGYGSDHVSAATQANYDLRLLLNAWNNGVARTYLFTLIDDGKYDGTHFQNFGIITGDGKYTPKPAYYVLKNLIAMLSDPGATFTPGSLPYTLSGRTSGVQTTLLQKKDGTFYLVVWIAEAAGGPSQAVRLNLASAATVNALTFDATGALAQVNLISSGSVSTFDATDTPVILSIH